MVVEWTLTAAVGLMVGISFGILLELKYIVDLDRKLEKLINKIEREEVLTEHEVKSLVKRKKRR